VATAAAGILLGHGHAGAIYNATGPVLVTGTGRAACMGMSDMYGPAHALKAHPACV
jgi:hypothetical protein